MLRAIELENFKAFGERARIPLAAITLIFGENSSGKSSILHALNLLKQTRESREAGALLLPRAEGGIVDLGSFQELLFNHDLNRALSIYLSIDTRSRPIRASGHRLWMAQLSSDQVGLELSFRRPSVDEEVKLERIRLFTGGASPGVLAIFCPSPSTTAWRRGFFGMVGRERTRHSSRYQAARCTWISDNEEYWRPSFVVATARKNWILTRLRDREDRLDKGASVHSAQLGLLNEETDGDPEEERRQELDAFRRARQFYESDFTLRQYVALMRELQLNTEIGLDGFLPAWSAIGADPLLEVAFELPPSRREVPLHVGQTAVLVGLAVDEVLQSLFPLGPFRRPPQRWYIFTGTSPQDVGYRGDLLPDLLYRRPELVEKTNEWLTRLHIGYQIELIPVGPRSKDLFEVRLADTRRQQSVNVSLSDVGFGISQILPLVVQSLASKGQIITIEQPEVHVHPRLQADLGDLIAESAKAPYGNQFIIETHSEHLILRIQRLVREKKLSPEDVSVVYVSRGVNGARVQQLRLDAEGDFIDEWPGGFFTERLRELV